MLSLFWANQLLSWVSGACVWIWEKQVWEKAFSITLERIEKHIMQQQT